MDNNEIKKLFADVFNNTPGAMVLEYLEKMFDVGAHPGTRDAEYIKVCQRSVVKTIRKIAGIKKQKRSKICQM